LPFGDRRAELLRRCAGHGFLLERVHDLDALCAQAFEDLGPDFDQVEPV
jgi:hypothetical protein